MVKLADIEALPGGARFYRADLHIHSFGASHDVNDQAMTPEAIVRTAVSERLSIIALTDHNEISNVERALAAASLTSLLVVPGVELSTPQGHLLCYLPTLASLQQFHGRLDLAQRDTSNSHCQTAMFECLKLLAELKGFAVLAHIDGGSGFEIVGAGGATPHRLNVICHPALLGIELKIADSDVSYSDTDPDAVRVGMGTERIARLGLGTRQYLARVLNSDAHKLNALGRNAQGDKKITRLKMDRPSFEGLRIALEDADARVRIEDLIPPSVPYVFGIGAEGSFLDGVAVKLSSNLNCIIGGRGTGKSTTFEGIRCLIEDDKPGDVVDSDVWPDHLHLFWQDQAGQRHSLHRAARGSLQHIEDPVLGPTSFQIESYGQGETARISADAQSNPVALLSYLDRFVDIRTLQTAEEAARAELLQLHGKVQDARRTIDKIPTWERDLETTQKQIATLEKANAKDVIALQRHLEQERSVRTRITAKLSEIEAGIGKLDATEEIQELIGLADPTSLHVGSAEFSEIIRQGKAFESVASSAQASAAAGFKDFRIVADAQLVAWKAKESAAIQAIDTKKRELEAQNIKLDMGYISKLTGDEARLQAELVNLRKWPPILRELEKSSAAASKRRWAARAKIAAARTGYAKQATGVLKSVLTDLTVSLNFAESAYAPDAEEQVINALNWRTSQVPRAALLIERLTLPGLISAIDAKDKNAVASVRTRDGVAVFNASEANRVLACLAEPEVRFALERAEVYDIPRLTVTAMVARSGGKPQAAVRDFSKLSLGQQQSVLLALMLSSKSNAPLIIDQPEDNLDREFIYKTLVPVLRLAKERRQIIIVTHNANIAVLGDAEQIIVFKSTNEKGSVIARGSIDDVATRDVVCNVLEGAKEAFQRRAKIYGVI
jgi:energy-coupling factor transporter ATP-binding protein EcfA2